MAGVGELQGPAQAGHLGQVVAAPVLDNLPQLLVADEAGVLAANPDVAMQGHVHAGTDGRAVDHGDGGLANQRDVAVEMGEAMEEVLAGGVRAFLGAPVADEVLPHDGRVSVAAHIGPGAEAAPHAGQHDDADAGVIIPGPHILADLGNGAALLGVADEGVHPLRAVELDPEDARIFRLIQQVVHQFRALARAAHFQRTLVSHDFDSPSWSSCAIV